MPQLTTKLHPDFDRPKTPFDRLFQTGDEALFYFDSRHLSRVSTFFKDLLELPLARSKVSTREAVDADEAIPLYFTTKLGFALLLHVLLCEFEPFPSLPKSVLEKDFQAALVNAEECAERFEIDWYSGIIGPLIVPTAIALKTVQPFQALALAILANHGQLVSEITWLTLAHPFDAMPARVTRLLEERDPSLLAKARHLHSVVKPAVIRLQQALLTDPIPEWSDIRLSDLPDCRRYACAITTGYNLEVDEEVSTTRRLAAMKVMEGLFLDASVRPRIDTIVARLNTCDTCNLRLAVLLSSLVLESESKYKTLC